MSYYYTRKSLFLLLTLFFSVFCITFPQVPHKNRCSECKANHHNDPIVAEKWKKTKLRWSEEKFERMMTKEKTKSKNQKITRYKEYLLSNSVQHYQVKYADINGRAYSTDEDESEEITTSSIDSCLSEEKYEPVYTVLSRGIHKCACINCLDKRNPSLWSVLGNFMCYCDSPADDISLAKEN